MLRSLGDDEAAAAAAARGCSGRSRAVAEGGARCDDRTCSTTAAQPNGTAAGGAGRWTVRTLAPTARHKTEKAVEFDLSTWAGEAEKLLPDKAGPAECAEAPAADSAAGIIGQIYSIFQASDNKLAIKLFGSKNAVLREQRRQQEAGSWIIHPCSNFKLFWDVTMLIFLATNLVVLPVSIAFFHDDEAGHWVIFNAVCDFMFFFDIIFNFRTGVINTVAKNEVILDSRLIAFRYLRTWFAIDVVSTFPLDYVLLALGESHGTFDYTTGRALRILRLAKLLQLLRILRISRLLRYVKLYQEFFSIASTIVRIFNLICVMVLLSHWSGCVQFFVPVLQGWPEDSWIVRYQLQGKPWWEQYSVALFKALSHMLCIGYGQHAPVNTTDTWLTMLSMLAGASCYAMLVGHTTALIQSFDVSSRLFRSHLQQVNEYMIYRKLPNETRKRVTDYYDHRYGGKMFNETEIMSELSESLRMEIITHNCRKLLDSVPFFENADENFVEDTITRMKFEFTQPGDVVIRRGSVTNKIYFIQEGWVEVSNGTGSLVTTLGYGSYFGEMGLLAGRRSVAEIRAATHCNLFSVTYDEFEKILVKYPLVRRTLQTVAGKRLQDLGEDPSLVLSHESLVQDLQDMLALSATIDRGPQRPAEDEHRTPVDDGEQTTPATTAAAEPREKRQLLTAVREFFTKESAALPVPSFSTAIFESPPDVPRGRDASPRGGSVAAANARIVLLHDFLAAGERIVGGGEDAGGGRRLVRSVSSCSLRRRGDVGGGGDDSGHGCSGGAGGVDGSSAIKRWKSVHSRPHPYF